MGNVTENLNNFLGYKDFYNFLNFHLHPIEKKYTFALAFEKVASKYSRNQFGTSYFLKK